MVAVDPIERESFAPPISSRHIPALDGLRGLAILAVFFHHYGAGGSESTSIVTRWIATVCGLGWSGVDLFFVLSGFLITGILYDTQDDPAYYRKFYARRALRIFPIYYLFAAIAILILPFNVWHAGDAFFLVYLGYPAALVWPALVNVPIGITHLWSLSVEEQFYALWPWLIRRLRSPSQILSLCAMAIIAALALRIMFPSWAEASLPCRMDDLALGGALAVLFRTYWREWCQRLALPAFAVSVVGLIVICAFRHTTAHSDRVVHTIGFSVIAVGYGALLVLAMGPLSGLFSIRLLRIFGKYSYGIYLFHFPLIPVMEHAKPLCSRLPLGSLIYPGFCLTANLAIAAISFHLFEQPILRLKNRFEYTRRPGAMKKTGVSPDHAASFELHSVLTDGLMEATIESQQ
jgi:peptidoglycan/LPS O-acetylase OafA/YrhL